MPPNSPSGEMYGPPQGSFTTSAVQVDDSKGNRTQHTGSLDEGNITGGNLTVSVVARDPYTGQTARLDSVTIKTGLGTLVTGVPKDGIFDLSCPSYDAFKRRDVLGMTATPRASNKVVQNQALPVAVKVKDTMNNFTDSAGAMCKKFDEVVQAGQKNLGLVHERDDIQVLQGQNNGRSPGVVVNQGQGSVHMFGNDGKQNVNIHPGGGIEMKTSSVNQGTALQENISPQYAGMPQMNNPVNSVVPQGTILTPQPQTVPQVLKILNMVATIVDMIELVKACKEAVDIIKNSDGQEEEEQLDELRREAEGPSSFEKVFMNDEQKAEAERGTNR